MEETVEHAVDRASYELGYEVSRRVYLKRVKDILDQERRRYTTEVWLPEGGAYEGGAIDALSHAIKAVEGLL